MRRSLRQLRRSFTTTTTSSEQQQQSIQVYLEYWTRQKDCVPQVWNLIHKLAEPPSSQVLKQALQYSIQNNDKQLPQDIFQYEQYLDVPGAVMVLQAMRQQREQQDTTSQFDYYTMDHVRAFVQRLSFQYDNNNNDIIQREYLKCLRVVKGGTVEEATECFQKLNEKTSDDYREMIHINTGRREDIEKLYNEAIERGLVDPPLFQAYLEGLMSTENLVEAEQALKREIASYPNNNNNNNTLLSVGAIESVLSEMAKYGHSISMIKILDSFPQQDDQLKFDMTFFHSILIAWSRPNGQAKACETILRRMQDKFSIAPDIKAYNTVLGAYAQEGNVQKAENLLHEMITNNLQPDSVSYTAVIKAWSRSGKAESVDRCEAFLQAMRENQIEPNNLTYATVMQAWSRMKRRDAIERVEKIWSTMMSEFEAGNTALRPLEAHYIALMITWTRNGKQPHYTAKRVNHYFSAMKERYNRGDLNLRPTVKIYLPMMDANRLAGSVDENEELLKEMKREYESGNVSAKPNARVYLSLLNTWSRSKLYHAPDRMKELIEEMKASNIEPTIQHYTTVLAYYAGGPKTTVITLAAEEFFKGLEDSGVKADEFTYVAMLRTYSRSPLHDAVGRAEALMDRMRSEGVSINSRAHLAFLSTLTRSRGAEQALDYLRRMDSPDSFHYAVVMDAFAERGDVAMVETLMKEVKNPSDGCHNSLLKAFWNTSEEVSWDRIMKAYRAGFRSQHTFSLMLELFRKYKPPVSELQNLLSDMKALKDTIGTTRILNKVIPIFRERQDALEVADWLLKQKFHFDKVQMRSLKAILQR